MRTGLRKLLRDGVKIPALPIRVRVEPSREARPDDEVELGVFRRHIARVGEVVPELRRYCEPARRMGLAECLALLAFFDEAVPRFHLPAVEPRLRSNLTRLAASVSDAALQERIVREIARSDFRSGVPERALPLRQSAPDETDGPTPAELEKALADAQAEYGSRAKLIESIDVWQTMTGDVRGRSLRAYFETIEAQLHGAAILHVSPESELEAWLRPTAARTKGEYLTLDPFRDNVDLRQDLTALDLPANRFDWVVCHRVLEHILDDGAAMREMHRVLRPGGRLSISVPQSMQMAKTNEWIVRDASHHDHVRQYGRDFVDRLADAGFAVSVVPLLLDRSLEDHLRLKTYPMRFYTCVKS